MVWWVPLIAAAVNMARSEHAKDKAEKDMTADTINRIKQHHAASLGADPSLGMATDNAINVGRMRRDYEPPTNAVGAAIQAMGNDTPSIGASAGSELINHGKLIDPWASAGEAPAAATDAVSSAVDPWDPYPEGFY